MIRISMYIPDRQFNDIMREKLISAFKKMCISVTIHSYLNAKGMEKDLKECNTDIFFFDFFDQTNSIRIAECIRKDDLYPAIILLRTPIGKLGDFLYLRPSACIDTAEDNDELLHILNYVCKEVSSKQQYFYVRYDGDIVRIPFRDIGYFESNAKKVTLNRIRNFAQYNFIAKLSDVESILPDHFIRCHQSYIVNMEYISKLDRKNRMLVLSTKEQIYISRRMLTEVSNKYESYLKKTYSAQ